VADNTDTDDSTGGELTLLSVDPSYFTTANANNTITTVPCILSDGSEAQCYEIVTNSTPTDHQMGPWCPENIADNAEAGGIWIEGGAVYDVDGAFIENMATFYNDDTWLMYDTNGDIYVTETEQECIDAANPNVGAAYQNYCVECLPSYITNIMNIWLIPATPVQQAAPAFFATGPGGGANTPSNRGVALNGVEFSAPAPVNNILGAYTIAPFDDAGGHINVNQGYHYHAATGVSFSIAQSDGHAPLIGYAMDGYGIYAFVDANGNEATGLDECRGQYDDIRGYHYHIDAAGNNNFINCLQGAFVVDGGEVVEPPDGGMGGDIAICETPDQDRCCGDGICGGPETPENCPQDCAEVPCEGTEDECGVCDGPGAPIWYQDADGDGLGNPEVTTTACEQPDGYVSNSDDDDDENATGSSTPVGAFDEFNPDAVTVSFNGDEITIESNALPNHTSPYWNTDNSLYIDPVVAVEQQMSPGRIGERNYTLTVPAWPVIAANPSSTGLGPIGISVTGVPIFNELEGPTGSLSENIASGFDYAGGHMGPTGYHYHTESLNVEENTVLSYDDDKLVGILMDGFLLYGRKQMDGSYPTDLDESGGHFGVTPHSNGVEVYHYHIINEFFLGSYIVLFGVDLKGTPNGFM